MYSFLNRKFLITSRGSTLRTEIMSGFVSYLAMSYIIFVNPSILGNSGMDKGAVFSATILASGIATFIMGWFANYPLGLAPCMSLNAFFTYTVVLNLNYSWQEALACVFLSSILFIILSLTKYRYKIIESIPGAIKHGATVGLGLFIAMIGLMGSSIVRISSNNTLTFGTFSNPNVLIAWIGIVVAGVLLVRGSRYAVLGSMSCGVVVGLIYRLLGSSGVINIPSEYLDTLPKIPSTFFVNPFGTVQTMMDTTFLAGPHNVVNILNISGIGLVFSILFLDFFGTAATLGAANTKLKEFGLSDNNKRVFLSDSIGTMFGAVFGTSNITTYVESVGGIVSGGRTGLTAIVTALLFMFSIFLYPFLSLVTPSVTTPALIIIGIVMIQNVVNIDWHKGYEEIIPAFLTIVLMPFLGSIALGLTFGFLSYGVLMVAAKRHKEISRTLWGTIIISGVYIISTLIG